MGNIVRRYKLHQIEPCLTENELSLIYFLKDIKYDITPLSYESNYPNTIFYIHNKIDKCLFLYNNLSRNFFLTKNIFRLLDSKNILYDKDEVGDMLVFILLYIYNYKITIQNIHIVRDTEFTPIERIIIKTYLERKHIWENTPA